MTLAPIMALGITIPNPRIEADEYFTDTDPSVLDPTPDILAVRQKHANKVGRRRLCRDKAARNPRNQMLRDLATKNGRIIDKNAEASATGDDIQQLAKKPRLPKKYKRLIRQGEVPSDLHKFHLPRGLKLRIKENKRRKAEAKVAR